MPQPMTEQERRRAQQQRRQPLRVPTGDVNRRRLQDKHQVVTRWVQRTLAAGGIAAKLRYIVGTAGTVLVVLSPQHQEAYLTLPPVINGVRVQVVLGE